MQRILGLMQKCIEKFNLIQEGDKIAVGISGGKDSTLLILALKAYQKFSPVNFDIIGVNIDLGLTLNEDEVKKQESFFNENNILFIREKTEIGPLIFDIRKETNPCSLCSKMRRGALNTLAIKHNCNKIALGHHSDDLIETFFLSLIYEGRLSTFFPSSYMSRSNITLIRPFLFVSEKEINLASKKLNIPTVHNPCPVDKHTKREEIKKLILELDNKFPDSKKRITRAIYNPQRNNLWDKINNTNDK